MDDSIVIRGGIMGQASLKEALRVAVAEDGAYLLSVQVVDFLDNVALADATERLRYNKVSACTASDLLAAGLILLPAPNDAEGPYHHHVKYPLGPAEADADTVVTALRAVFRGPIKKTEIPRDKDSLRGFQPCGS